MNIHVKPVKRRPVYAQHNRTRLVGSPSFRGLSPDIRLWPSLAAGASRPAPHVRAARLFKFLTNGQS
jgi:hypothetical protein